MRTLVTVFRVAVIVVILAAAAQGREMAGKIGITPQVGIVIPAGEFGEDQAIGHGYELDVEYFLRNNLSIGVRAFHTRLPNANGAFWNQAGFGYDEDIWPIEGFGAHMRYHRAVTPFTDVFGRLGFVLCRMDFPINQPYWAIDPQGSRETKTCPSISLGAGLLRYLSTRFAFYGELEYKLHFTKGLRIEREPAELWGNYDVWFNAQTVAIKMGLTLYLGGE